MQHTCMRRTTPKQLVPVVPRYAMVFMGSDLHPQAMHAAGVRQRLTTISSAAGNETTQSDDVIHPDELAAEEQQVTEYESDVVLDLEQQEQEGEPDAEDEASQDWIDLDDPFNDSLGSEDDVEIFAPAKQRQQSDEVRHLPPSGAPPPADHWAMQRETHGSP